MSLNLIPFPQKATTMCLYSHQISFTSSAWHALMEDPIDPLGPIRKPIQSLGGNLVSAFFTEVAIAEFPANVTADDIAISFYSGGAVATIHCSPLLTANEAAEAKRKARQRSFQPKPHGKSLAASA